MLWEVLEAKWGIPKPWGGASRGGGGVVALNQKVVDKFLKACVEGKGAHQGSWPQRPVNPLLPREVEHSLPSFLHQWLKILSV